MTAPLNRGISSDRYIMFWGIGISIAVYIDAWFQSLSIFEKFLVASLKAYPTTTDVNMSSFLPVWMKVGCKGAS